MADELSFLEWRCIEHLALKREENRISLLNLGLPAMEANRGKKKTHFPLLSLAVRTHSMEIVEAKKNFDLVANVQVDESRHPSQHHDIQ